MHIHKTRKNKVKLGYSIKFQSNQMNLEKHYGKCINVYKGTGHLVLNKKEFACEFEAGQLLNGKIILLCASGPTHYFPFLFANGLKFDGQTTDGRRVHIRGSSSTTNFLGDRSGTGSWTALNPNELVVTFSDKRPARLRFALTNFKFHGEKVLLDRFLHESLRVRLTEGGNWWPVYLRQIEDYKRTMRRLQTLKGIEVTCTAEAEVKRGGGIKYIETIIDRLCRVASVARGTKIQWIYEDRLDKDGNLLARIHASRLTKPYCPLSIIDYQKDDEDTWLFLESAYTAFCKRREEYELELGTIDSYLDAKSEGDFVETRGAKLALALEALKHLFLNRPGTTVSEFIVQETTFQGLSSEICLAIDDVLKRDPSIKDTERKLIANEFSIRGLNRRSFRYALKKLFKDIKFKPSEREIDLFIQCRNKLVHTSDFYCRSASTDERARCAPLATPIDEYYFMVNFLDRVFLKLLGYSGQYLHIGKIVKGEDGLEKVDDRNALVYLSSISSTAMSSSPKSASR